MLMQTVSTVTTELCWVTCVTLCALPFLFTASRRRLAPDVLGSSCPRIIALANYISRVTEHLTIHSSYKCEQKLNSL